MGQIHTGFGHCLALALQKIQRMLIHRDMKKPLLITGHSLGGALAALAGVCFVLTRTTAKVPEVRRIYTFGQPRVGVQKFCTSYDRFVPNKLIRFVNDRDLVPRVPLRSQLFADSGRMIHFDSSGVPTIESQEWNDFLNKPFGTIEEVLDMMMNAKAGVADHSMLAYREKVEKNQAGLALLLPTSSK
jgi:triacylglycerol lipase